MRGSRLLERTWSWEEGAPARDGPRGARRASLATTPLLAAEIDPQRLRRATLPRTRTAVLRPSSAIAPWEPLTRKPPGDSPKRSRVSPSLGALVVAGAGDPSSAILAPSPPARQHSASATARPPSAMSWALDERSLAHRLADGDLGRDRAWRSTAGSAVGQRLTAQLRELAGGQRGRVARGRPARSCRPPREAEPAGARARPGRRRPSRSPASGRSVPPGALVVEANVAADDRRLQRAARVAEAAHGLRQLPRDVRLLGVAEVEVVGRPRAAVPRRRRGSLRTRAPPRSCRGRDRRRRDARCSRSHRERASVGQREHRRVGLLGAAHRARLDDRVVLLEQGPPGGDVRRGEQREQRLARIRRAARVGRGGA